MNGRWKNLHFFFFFSLCMIRTPAAGVYLVNTCLTLPFAVAAAAPPPQRSGPSCPSPSVDSSSGLWSSLAQALRASWPPRKGPRGLAGSGPPCRTSAGPSAGFRRRLISSRPTGRCRFLASATCQTLALRAFDGGSIGDLQSSAKAGGWSSPDAEGDVL